MMELKAIGVKLALMISLNRHANLHYLLKYPFDTVKIDKEFVTGIESPTSNKRLCDVFHHGAI